MIGDFRHRIADIEPARRELFVAITFLVLLLVVGTLGYQQIEHDWSFLDGLYMTFITMTTIGFSEVSPLSEGGRLFTIIIGCLGIGAVAFIASRLAQLLLTRQIIRTRHMESKIAHLTKHYIFSGYGTVGR